MISSRLVLVFALLSFSSLSNATLIFSEYIEGTSYNKALEVFNTGDAIDFSMDNYVIDIYTNGATSSRYSVSLSGLLASQDTFVLGHSSADTEITSVADMLSSSINFNGDDAVTLSRNGVIIDRIGQVGVDPGSEWGVGLMSTQNNTLARQSTVLTGDVNVLLAFDPSIQWIGYESNYFSGLGSHEFSNGQVQNSAESSVAVPLPGSGLLIISGLVPLLVVGVMQKRKNLS